MLQKLRARIRKCGGTITDVLEFKHEALILEIIRGAIQYNLLD